MSVAARKRGKIRTLDVCLALVCMAGVFGFGLSFLYIFTMIWIYGEVTLFEPNRIILALETCLSLVMVALALILSRRLGNWLKRK